MFDMGFLELLVIATIALLVLGPERLPIAAKTVGNWVAKSRGFANNIRDELEREANLAEMREQLTQQKEDFKEQIHGLESQKQELLDKVEKSMSLEPSPDSDISSDSGSGPNSDPNSDKVSEKGSSRD